jgi:hypothetical protein
MGAWDHAVRRGVLHGIWKCAVNSCGPSLTGRCCTQALVSFVAFPPTPLLRYFAVAVSLLTGCNVCGIEIVEDRCRLATAVVRSLADWIVLACTSTPMCSRKACASIRAAALSRIPRAACSSDEDGRPREGYHAEEIEEVFGDECVCSVLECLNLDHLCDSGVTLRRGNVLLNTDLTEEEIAAADVIFCNNYRGCECALT